MYSQMLFLLVFTQTGIKSHSDRLTLIHCLCCCPSKETCNTISSINNFNLILKICYFKPLPIQFIRNKMKLGVAIAAWICYL